MSSGPVVPKETVVPAGFVDAFGLDDDDIPYRPFVVQTQGSRAAAKERTSVKVVAVAIAKKLRRKRSKKQVEAKVGKQAGRQASYQLDK